MNELPIKGFIRAIRQTHGAKAYYRERVLVDEEFEGHPVWTDEVLVFDLLDHPTASLCYAWEVDGRFTSVLHEFPVYSPIAAVRAAIVAESKK